MHPILFIFTADNSPIGRFDHSMLSDQMLMELFYVPDDKEKSHAAMKGQEDDACTWRNITRDEA